MTGPLRGVRVIELAGIGPGPFCGMLLADLGADVVRVERPGGGLTVVPWERDPLNRNKRSVAVDLKQPDGVETVMSLVERADILFEGFRPGVAERLGIGPEHCWARRPQLVYGRMTGWGQDGPLSQAAGHDLAYIALTGALHAIGDAGNPPQVPLNLVGDLGGGSLYLAVGMLAALLEARASNQGQVVDAAIVDGAANLMTMLYGLRANGAWNDARGTNLIDGGCPYYSVYETSDGKYMAVSALEPKFYAEFVKRLGIDEPLAAQHDRSRWPHLREHIAGRMRTRTQAEWVEVFGASDACVAPVLDMEDAPAHSHLAERHTFVNAFGMVQPAPAPRFTRTPGAVRTPPPTPGSTSVEDVLSEWKDEDGVDRANKVTK
jgi:alpha-methylacyl-CoA racemase